MKRKILNTYKSNNILCVPLKIIHATKIIFNYQVFSFCDEEKFVKSHRNRLDFKTYINSVHLKYISYYYYIWSKKKKLN